MAKQKIDHTARLLTLLFLFCCLGPTTWVLAAGSEHPAQAAAEIQKLYSGLGSLTFDFSQTTIANARKRSGTGNAIFYRFTSTITAQRTSVMRWNYTSPDVQVIINDGSTTSIYTERDKQMIITPTTELESDITYRLLAGNQNVLDEFTIEAGDPSLFSSASSAASGKKLQALLLTPKEPNSQMKRIVIVFSENHTIEQLLIEDHFDSVTELFFHNISFNSLPVNDLKTEESVIEFQAPPDTEIITQ